MHLKSCFYWAKIDPDKLNQTTSTATNSNSFIDFFISVAVSEEKHCDLSPIRAPSVYGLSFLKMMELVGLFPWNTWNKQDGEGFHHADHLVHDTFIKALTEVWIQQSCVFMVTGGHYFLTPVSR